MLRIALCDDNGAYLAMAVEEVRRICAEVLPGDTVLTVGPCFGSAEQVQEFLKVQPIDLLLLDIDMPQISGFELARRLQTVSPSTVIVFLSAYDRFVYDAFAFSPFAYLRKERLREDLPSVLKRWIRRLNEQKQAILLSTVAGDRVFFLKDLLYLESMKNYFTVHMRGGESVICRGTLSTLEKQLLTHGFYRIHSAYLVNMEQVEYVVGNELLLRECPARLPVSRSKQSGFKKAYAEYMRRCFSL